MNEYKVLFYRDKLKIIPENLDKLFTARGLAYRIMGNGGGKSSYDQINFHTRSFSKKEISDVEKVLNKNFDLTTRIEKNIKNQWIKYIPVKQKVKLKDIVGSYMHKSML